jgi:hypothetical protein
MIKRMPKPSLGIFVTIARAFLYGKMLTNEASSNSTMSRDAERTYRCQLWEQSTCGSTAASTNSVSRSPEQISQNTSSV